MVGSFVISPLRESPAAVYAQPHHCCKSTSGNKLARPSSDGTRKALGFHTVALSSLHPSNTQTQRADIGVARENLGATPTRCGRTPEASERPGGGPATPASGLLLRSASHEDAAMKPGWLFPPGCWMSVLLLRGSSQSWVSTRQQDQALRHGPVSTGPFPRAHQRCQPHAVRRPSTRTRCFWRDAAEHEPPS